MRPVQEFDATLLEPFNEDGVSVPLLRLNRVALAPVELRVGGSAYRYERSYPIKGHSAVMPKYLREQISAGKRPLVVERISRYYVYMATDAGLASG